MQDDGNYVNEVVDEDNDEDEGVEAHVEGTLRANVTLYLWLTMIIRARLYSSMYC